MASRTTGKIGALIAVIMMLSLAFAPTASAHAKRNFQWVYWSSHRDCVGNTPKITHNSTYPGGISKGTVQYWYLGYDSTAGAWYSCYSKEYVPAGYLAMKVFYMKWDGSSWGVCRQTAWRYSQGLDFKFWVRYRFTSPPCGKGYYRTISDGFAYSTGQGKWLGGRNGSDSHWMPSS